MEQSLGSRMKSYYEEAYLYKLPMRLPVIIRLDGRAFHTLTRNLNKPFDNRFIDTMAETAAYVVSQIQGARCAYVQSDEISILLVNYNKLNSDAWFNNEVQKMTSVSASMATWKFNQYDKFGDDPATFDSRVFILPESEVTNYFIWRQQDWTRNSVQMLAGKYYSHNERLNKNNAELQEMIYQKDGNWSLLPPYLRRGTMIQNMPYTFVNWDIPIFTENRTYIEQFLDVED